jgi:hypothetical protein
MGLTDLGPSGPPAAGLLAPFPNVRERANLLGANQPEFADATAGLIQAIDTIGEKELGLDRFVQILGIMPGVPQ